MSDKLALEPATVAFDAAAGGTVTVAVTNQSEGRLAVKVKCSDNNLYKVRPVFSIVEPGTALSIEIIRSPAGPAKEDKLVLQHAAVEADEQDPQAPFKTPGTFDEVRLPLQAS